MAIERVDMNDLQKAKANDEEEYYKSLLVDYDPMEDPYVGPLLRDDNVLKYIKMFHLFECIDTNSAIPIIVDLQQLQKRDIDLDCLFCFVRVLLNKHTLEIYDRPGDPSMCGYFHLKKECYIHELYRQVAVYAFDWYHNNHPQGKGKRLKEVNRLSCSPDCYAFFHFTFTVVDDLTQEEITLQAQVIQFSVGDWLLGMLRDSTHDQVLATIRFKNAPTGDAYDIFKRELGDVLEKIML